MIGGKWGNRTPVLSLTVKEVALIYHTVFVLDTACTRWVMTPTMITEVSALATRIELAC